MIWKRTFWSHHNWAVKLMPPCTRIASEHWHHFSCLENTSQITQCKERYLGSLSSTASVCDIYSPHQQKMSLFFKKTSETFSCKSNLLAKPIPFRRAVPSFRIDAWSVSLHFFPSEPQPTLSGGLSEECVESPRDGEVPEKNQQKPISDLIQSSFHRPCP